MNEWMKKKSDGKRRGARNTSLSLLLGKADRPRTERTRNWRRIFGSLNVFHAYDVAFCQTPVWNFAYIICVSSWNITAKSILSVALPIQYQRAVDSVETGNLSYMLLFQCPNCVFLCLNWSFKVYIRVITSNLGFQCPIGGFLCPNCVFLCLNWSFKVYIWVITSNLGFQCPNWGFLCPNGVFLCLN